MEARSPTSSPWPGWTARSWRGGFRPIDGSRVTLPFYLPPDALVTHAVVLGMTGSGKPGLLMVLVGKAMRSSIPVEIDGGRALYD